MKKINIIFINAVISIGEFIDDNFDTIMVCFLFLGFITQMVLIYVFSIYGLLWYAVGFTMSLFYIIIDEHHHYNKTDIFPQLIISICIHYVSIIILIKMLSNYFKSIKNKWKNKHYRRKKIIDNLL